MGLKQATRRCHRRFFTRVSGKADVGRFVWVRGGTCLKWPATIGIERASGALSQPPCHVTGGCHVVRRSKETCLGASYVRKDMTRKGTIISKSKQMTFYYYRGTRMNRCCW